MNVLLLGSGGREHAFAWKIAQSPLLKKLYIAPGNAGTAQTGENVALNPNDFEALGKFCVESSISMVVVGPEEPLVKGIKDYFAEKPGLKHLLLVGPDRSGARLEGSKDFSKRFMQRYGIPTASYASFTQADYEEALRYVSNHTLPVVLKADGPAAGKGVIIAQSHQEAREALSAMLKDEQFGESSKTVVVEAFLQGIELSVFVLTDGNNYKVLPEAKDYKRIGEGDTGLNTGGMGAISPVFFADETFMKKVEQKITLPTLQGLKQEGIDYKGFIFIGLMNVNGEPFVIEYNVRMGDPETEAVLPRIKSDWLALLKASCEGTLNLQDLEIDPGASATVILASQGYPGDYEKGKLISGTESQDQNTLVFHAGTRRDEQGRLLSNGGRVLALTSLAAQAEHALQKSLQKAENIHFEGKYYRRDIGKDLAEAQAKQGN